VRKFVALMVLAALTAFEGAAFAGIVGSPHDIAAQGYAVQGREEKKKNVCNYCHVPHKAKGARLWAVPPPSLKGWGTVGPLCYSCHDGVTIASPNVDASNTAFNPRSHGLSLSDLPDGDDVSGSGLPYTSNPAEGSGAGAGGATVAVEGAVIECSTCHNPHDNTNRPFLQAPLTELCERCHQQRVNSGIGVNNAESTHPVHMEPLDNTGNASPIDVQDAFKTAFPNDYPSEGGKEAIGVHWTLGGHLSKGTEGNVECITCHNVHGREVTGPPSATGLLAMDPVLDYADEFCEGCHRGKRNDGLAEPPFPNPGGTPFYHPVDDDQMNGPGRKVEINEPEGWNFGKGGELLCTTCHKPHRALVSSPILRPMLESATFCEECHSQPPPSHHPVGVSTVSVSNVGSGKKRAQTREIKISQDFPAGLAFGKPQPGVIYCSTCHGAHNVKCKALLPALAISCGDGDGGDCSMCLNCHPKFNPTWQTDDAIKASHFIGDPTSQDVELIDKDDNNAGTQQGYDDQYPPENTEVWPESNLKSVYGGSDNKEVTCCSCHTFGVNGVTAGDADQSPYLGPLLAPGYQQSDLTTGLLARAGSYKEWQEGDVIKVDIGGDRGTEDRVDKYLCTGCHGLRPNSHPTSDNGEGLTHPLMDADGTKVTPQDPVSLTFNQHVNCESCHQPHEADSRGGFFILRDVALRFTGVSSVTSDDGPHTIRKRTDIEFAPLCQKCHAGY